MVKTADYSAVDVKCPFYMSNNEIKDSIKCEGVFSLSATHIFGNNRLKQEHKEKYCNTFDYKFCQHYIRVISTYKPNPKEMPGTFSEYALLKYRQK